MKIKTILAPTDFSMSARTALRWAAELAQQHGASLVVSHVYPVPGYVLPDGFVTAGPEALVDAEQRVRAALQTWADDARSLGAPEVSIATAIGQPAAEILAHADAIGADLIVVASHGLHGLALVLLGSTAERLVRHARVPVLVVPRGVETPPG